MFENQLSNRRLSPVSAYLAVTSACPYNCWHCSLKNRRAGHLDTAQWLDIIAQLHEVGCSVMGFTGGEPLCRQDLPQLIEAASRGGAETILYTCGAMINDEWIERLKQAGLWSICVSYDHPDPAMFDQKRGKPGAAQAAEQAIRLSARHGFYTMIGSVATREFVAEKHYKLLLNKAKSMGVHEFRIVEPMPCGKLSQASRDTFLTADMIQELRDFHVRANKRLGGPKVCAFNQIESPELFGCGGGTQHMFIDPAGEVTPCDFTPLSFGNLREEKLKVVWLRMVEAMGGAPRRHCFIQKNHQLIDKHGNGHTFPLPQAVSQTICAEAGQEELPDYFQMLLSAKQKP
ncbi:radical SAM protein [bacterium]|nr:radical SAM protein [bacterium]